MTYDEKCYDLAAEFLEDDMLLFTERNNVELARAIQETIENWMKAARDNWEPPE